MVTTLLKSTLREIRQSLGRYLAIFAIILLGVGVYGGLKMSQPNMMATGKEYIDDHRLFDFRMLSTLGFTAEDVAAFRRANPQADVVLLGHSMGGAAALQVATLLPEHEGAGRVFVVTLDPVDRIVQPVRPQGVSWWGNAYVENSLSGHDFIAVVGGRWGHCEQADLNICFDGRRTDEYGYHYIHDDAEALFTSAGGQPAGALCAALTAQLQRKGAKSQADVAQKAQRPKANGSQGK